MPYQKENIRLMKKAKVIKYRDFEITIFSNRYSSFKFEYELRAITQNRKFILKKLMKSNPKFRKHRFDIIQDVTFNKTISQAATETKWHIDEICFMVSSFRLKYG